jgi:hypothetical protein
MRQVCGQSCATPTPDRRGLGALLGQLVDPAPPTSCGRPAALDQASLLEPVKRWVKRSFKDIKLAAAAVMQFLDDRVSMAREEDLLSRPRRVCSSTRGQNLRVRRWGRPDGPRSLRTQAVPSAQSGGFRVAHPRPQSRCRSNSGIVYCGSRQPESALQLDRVVVPKRISCVGMRRDV